MQNDPHELSLLVIDLIENELRESMQIVTPIIGGDESKTFSVTTNRTKRIVKLQPENEYHRFLKEQWCIEQAFEVDIPGASVLSLGKRDGFTYMILSFIPGSAPQNSEAEKKRIWNTLGTYAKRIHAISLHSFGHNMYQKGVFEGTWPEFLEYNIRSLNETDVLLDLKIIHPKQSKLVRKMFEQLRDIPFTIGLCHGDLSFLNVLMGEDGTKYLYDWGQAEANIVPYFDVIGILENHPGSQKEMKLFLQGYGIEESALPHLNILWLLKRIDKLRWAIDKSPHDIPEYSKQVKTRLHFIDTNS